MSEEQEKTEQKHPGGRPRILQSVEATEQLIELYFKNHPEKPTISGLALHLGFADRKSIFDYIDRGDEFSLPIKKAIARIEEEHESRLYGDKCTGSIFWLKNRGWKDSHDVTSGGKPIPPTLVSFANAAKQEQQGDGAG